MRNEVIPLDHLLPPPNEDPAAAPPEAEKKPPRGRRVDAEPRHNGRHDGRAEHNGRGRQKPARRDDRHRHDHEDERMAEQPVAPLDAQPRHEPPGMVEPQAA